MKNFDRPEKLIVRVFHCTASFYSCSVKFQSWLFLKERVLFKKAEFKIIQTSIPALSQKKNKLKKPQTNRKIIKEPILKDAVLCKIDFFL